MAARKDPRNRDSSNKLTQATQLLNRLIAHANGELDLTQTQINAIKIVLAKFFPDLKAVENKIELKGHLGFIEIPSKE